MATAEKLARSIPAYRAGPINDDVLEFISRTGRAAQNDEPLSDDAGKLILLCLPQIAEELLQRRRLMRTIEDLSSPDQVIFLSPGAEG